MVQMHKVDKKNGGKQRGNNLKKENNWYGEEMKKKENCLKTEDI